MSLDMRCSTTPAKLQYEVKVDRPDPVFAKYLQQAIGGIEGEIRVAMQYFFQAMGARGDAKVPRPPDDDRDRGAGATSSSSAMPSL